MPSAALSTEAAAAQVDVASAALDGKYIGEQFDENFFHQVTPDAENSIVRIVERVPVLLRDPFLDCTTLGRLKKIQFSMRKRISQPTYKVSDWLARPIGFSVGSGLITTMAPEQNSNCVIANSFERLISFSESSARRPAVQRYPKKNKKTKQNKTKVATLNDVPPANLMRRHGRRQQCFRRYSAVPVFSSHATRNFAGILTRSRTHTHTQSRKLSISRLGLAHRRRRGYRMRL